MIEFTKELFIETIKSLEYQFKYDEKYTNIASGIFDAKIPEYKNLWIKNQLIKLLQLIFEPDCGAYSKIEKFIFDDDFGKSDNARMKNSEELYKLLTNQKE